jgi:hypothetical protein
MLLAQGIISKDLLESTIPLLFCAASNCTTLFQHLYLLLSVPNRLHYSQSNPSLILLAFSSEKLHLFDSLNFTLSARQIPAFSLLHVQPRKKVRHNEFQ